MIINMRTTLIIEDRLFREAKRRAAARGISLSALVGEALRGALASRSPRAPRFEMVTYGRRGPSVRHSPEDFAAALAEGDGTSLGR
jgi:hypothetical protein